MEGEVHEEHGGKLVGPLNKLNFSGTSSNGQEAMPIFKCPLGKKGVPGSRALQRRRGGLLFPVPASLDARFAPTMIAQPQTLQPRTCLPHTLSSSAPTTSRLSLPPKPLHSHAQRVQNVVDDCVGLSGVSPVLP
jgi:hypothetical protein